MNPPTELIESLRVKHTAIRTCAGDDGVDYGELWQVWMIAENQSFCTTPVATDSKNEANWFQTQLATALARIVTENQIKT